ncbi:hypothetical protein BU24DRAFT_440884 [Aaosphaeria arxii CBS 175.79]|uniref:Uncharacterized protein n=1 Tax=Aaosphaeria arxii CBS 175.79 TaxID=1450172 RepID=A0A6A5Y088_9PLEO|nr:uncharacterized protein BU24DRAFT_440884 [Aaosphaeria arxii CBS 175.79]KAF2018250.1 hypothetical protein BU24DRAFT_440884 [Aaosphaeria arxii CBS 175.79]
MAKLAEKLPSFLRPKPVFNQRVDTEKRYHISRALYITFLVALVILSTGVIGLKAMTLNFIEDNENTGFVFETEDADVDSTILAALPRMLYTAPAKLAVVAAAISIFVGSGHAVFVVMDWKEGKRTQTYSFRRNIMFLHFTNSIMVLFSLVSIFVTHKSTSHFFEGYVIRKADRPGEGVRYNIGTFDLETWSCELKTVEGAKMVWEDYSRQCDIEQAGRAVMIPFMIVAFVIAAVGIADMMKCRRQDANGLTMKTEDVNAEFGKMNAV